MHISSRARAVADRVTSPRHDTGEQVKLPRRYGQLALTAASMLIGATGGAVYEYAVAGHRSLLVMSLAAVGGAALGYLILAVPRLTLHYFLNKWYRLIHRHWQEVWQRQARQAVQRLAKSVDDAQALGNLGIAHYLLGAAEKAADYLDQACQRAADHPNLLNAQAAAQAAEGHWDQAVQALLTAKQLQPDYPPTSSNLATLLATMPSGSNLARILGNTGITSGVRTLNNLAVHEIKDGNTQAATAHLQQALRQRPYYAHAQANLGVLALGDNDLQTAVLHLAAAAQFVQNNSDILSNLAVAMVKAGYWARAAAVLRRARRLEPRHMAVAINEGCLQVEMGRYEEAAQRFRTIPAGEPNSPLAWHNMAVAYASLERYEEAKEYALQAGEARPTDPDVFTTLGAIEWELGDYQQARARFQYVLEMVPESLGATVNLARGAIAAGDEQEALKVLQNLASDYPDDAHLTFDLAVAYLMAAVRRWKREMNRTERQLFLNSVDASVEAFQKDLSHAEGMIGESHFNLGLAYYLRDEQEIAAHHFQKALELLPEGPEIYFCLGTALAEEAFNIQHRHEAESDELVPTARTFLQQACIHLKKAAVATHPTAAAFCNLGLVSYRLDRIDEAVKALRRFVHLEPTAEAYNDLALVYAKQGQEMYRRSHVGSLMRDIRSGVALDKARRLLSTAIHYFSEALRSERQNPVLHSNIGLAYMLRNHATDVEQALRHWQLMRQTGGEWAERQFERMLEFMHTEQTVKAEFHDVHMSLRPIDIMASINGLPPLMGEVLYVVEPVMDRGPWELEATDPDVQTALRARRKAFTVEQRLRRLSV